MARTAEPARALESAGAGRRGRALARWVNSPWGPATLAFVAYGIFVLERLRLFHGDVSRFVAAGDTFFKAGPAAQVGLTVIHHNIGYDGQFYYLLALNPFGPHPALAGAMFDTPAYRAQRILYPFLVWLLTLGGHARFVPLAMLLVNFAAVVALAALAALAARRLGVAPALAAIVVFYPGLLLSLGRDLSEPLALACALGGVVCALDRRWRWAALLLSLAVLGRETTVAFGLALLAAAVLARVTPLLALRLPALRLVAREEWRGAALAGLAPLVVGAVWQVVLLLRWGQMGLFADGPKNIGAPLLGLREALYYWPTLPWPALYLRTHQAEALYLLALAALVAVTLARRRSGAWLGLAWAGYLLIGLCFSVIVWIEDWAFMRAMMEYGVTSLLLLTTARPILRQAALLATMVVWGLVFVSHVGAY
ncbi:MAG: hypothetical protein KGO05_13870 [Chloroflexota bacterium]|nr:hypothetical protein [Chloroflexota bacterium]